MCLCVCVCVCVCACVWGCVSLCMWALSLYLRSCLSVYPPAYLLICISDFDYIYIYIYILYIRVCVCLCLSVPVCMCLSICNCLSVSLSLRLHALTGFPRFRPRTLCDIYLCADHVAYKRTRARISRKSSFALSTLNSLPMS